MSDRGGNKSDNIRYPTPILSPESAKFGLRMLTHIENIRSYLFLFAVLVKFVLNFYRLFRK